MSEKKSTDEIAFGPEVAPGMRVALRRQNGAVREILARPLKSGEALQPGGELAGVSASSREDDGEHWHELTSVYKNGPPQVATPAYRAGYDRIFGKKQEAGLA